MQSQVSLCCSTRRIAPQWAAEQPGLSSQDSYLQVAGIAEIENKIIPGYLEVIERGNRWIDNRDS